MKEKLISYAETLVSNKSIMSILKDLKVIFEENGMFFESGVCIEKMCNITPKANLYQIAGDVFLYKARNRVKAFEAYNKYLRYSKPDFYKKYCENLNCLGFKKFRLYLDVNKDTKKFINLCDRFDIIVYIMMLLYKKEDYDGVLQFRDFLTSARMKIINYMNSHRDLDLSYKNVSKNNEMNLAALLSKTVNNIDINKFAIQINPNLITAYINIIGDYITHKNYEHALLFFNNIYARKFNVRQHQSVANICWHLSDFYRNHNDFWQAVNYQKMSLEIELGER